MVNRVFGKQNDLHCTIEKTKNLLSAFTCRDARRASPRHKSNIRMFLLMNYFIEYGPP